jgi:hypothetical protein
MCVMALKIFRKVQPSSRAIKEPFTMFTSRSLFSVENPCAESTDSKAFARHSVPYPASFVAERNLSASVEADMTLWS